MASMRNINTQGNYNLEQRNFRLSENYALYPNSQYGAAYNTRLPGNGLTPAQIPWNKLSYNAAYTESFLFGINSTNLVNPAPCFVPEITKIIHKILQEWKGYIKIDDNGRYKGDYYLSINNVENYHSHIHLMINCHENSLCYKIKKNDNHSQLYIINNTKFDNIVEEMIQKYNHFKG